jgi:hypothetical protein
MLCFARYREPECRKYSKVASINSSMIGQLRMVGESWELSLGK